tara:strand:- start:369 stop:542 length:174 start_codon:yes stop_codon:yes gene_type:complete
MKKNDKINLNCDKNTTQNINEIGVFYELKNFFLLDSVLRIPYILIVYFYKNKNKGKQ